MISALYVAKTGLCAQDLKLTAISNNLANVASIGFKRDRAEFQYMQYKIKRQYGSQSSQASEFPLGLQFGTGVQIRGTKKLRCRKPENNRTTNGYCD